MNRRTFFKSLMGAAAAVSTPWKWGEAATAPKPELPPNSVSFTVSGLNSKISDDFVLHPLDAEHIRNGGWS